MIENDRDGTQMICDVCNDDLGVYDREDFPTMIADAKRQGWRIVQSGGGWSHTCPSCVEKKRNRA